MYVRMYVCICSTSCIYANACMHTCVHVRMYICNVYISRTLGHWTTYHDRGDFTDCKDSDSDSDSDSDLDSESVHLILLDSDLHPIQYTFAHTNTQVA